MPKHISIPLVNQDKLNKLVLKHKTKLANMEIYEHIAKTGAVSGEGLLQLGDVLSDIVELQECAELQHHQMKSAFTMTGKFFPKVLPTSLFQKIVIVE